MYIETLGTGTRDRGSEGSEKSLRDIASIVMKNNGINLILFVMAAGRLNTQEQLNGMLVKQLFPTVPVVFVRPRLDGSEETVEKHNESLSAIRQLFNTDQLCDYVFGTFKHIQFINSQNQNEWNKWEDQIRRSVATLKTFINKCASPNRIKTSFTDNIKNVFRNVFKLGFVGLIAVVKGNENPFQNH